MNPDFSSTAKRQRGFSGAEKNRNEMLSKWSLLEPNLGILDKRFVSDIGRPSLHGGVNQLPTMTIRRAGERLPGGCLPTSCPIMST